MSDSADSAKTEALFTRWSNGEHQALDELLAHLYRDIHAIAVRELRSERYLTIRPTVLVHEVYLRMVELREPNWTQAA